MVGGGALALTLIPASAAEARQFTFKVVNLNPFGPGSFERAIADLDKASSSPKSPGLITFASSLSGSINLGNTLTIYGSADIRGPGDGKIKLTTAGNGDKGPLFIEHDRGTPLTISGLSLVNALPNTLYGGGAIDSNHDAITLDDDVFSYDSGVDDGVIDADGGSVTINKSTFAEDSSTKGGGGAVGVTDGTLNVNASTFINNKALSASGGAIAATSSSVRITDSTFVGNEALDDGALFLTHSKSTIISATITGNEAIDSATNNTEVGFDGADGYGGGLGTYGGSLTVENTVLTGNTRTANPNYDSGQPRYSAINMYIEGSTKFAVSSSMMGGDDQQYYHGKYSHVIISNSPDLGPLEFNGGPTETEAPTKGSRLIDAGKAFGLKTDQRGDKRTVDYPGVKKRNGSDGTDIGAVEVQAPKRR
jgi:predicted outer membrane repeat protein